MDKARLISLIQNPEITTPADTLALTNLVRAFPFFQSAHLLLLYNLKRCDNEIFDRQLRESAIFVADRKVLFNFLFGIAPESPKLRPTEQNQTKVVEKQQKKEEFLDFQIEENLPILIIDAIPDTDSKHFKSIKTELLEIDETPRSKGKDKTSGNDLSEVSDTSSQIDIIDKFIQEDPAFKPNKIDQGAQNEDISKHSVAESEDLATETLALIYTSQKLFQKAILVYEKLILKFPEKSAYFASRIEELKKNIK